VLYFCEYFKDLSSWTPDTSVLFQIREIDAGHVTGCVMHYPDFVKATIDTFARLIEKHYAAPSSDEKHPTSTGPTALDALKAFDRQLVERNVAFSLRTWLRGFAAKS